MVGTGRSLKETRVIDPILTTMAQGFKQLELVGMNLLPFAEVVTYGGRIIEFDRACFQTYNSRRSPGAATKRIQTGYTSNTAFNLILDALEHALPDEQISEAGQIGINWSQYAMDACMSGLTLNLEVEQAALLRNASNYASNNKIALSGTSRFNNAASTPSAVIRAGKEAVRAAIGVYPNVMEIPAAVLPGLQENPEIRDKLKYTSSESITPEMLAQIYGFQKVVVGMAIADDITGTPTDVWGKDIIMSYVNPAALGSNRLTYQTTQQINRYAPATGYTYVMQGHPMAKPKYHDDNADAWIFGAKLHRQPVLTGVSGGLINSGYLIQTAVD
jgi:hypothetical protein